MEPSLIWSTDGGASLWRAKADDTQNCLRCGTWTWWFWYRRWVPKGTLKPVGFFCALRCALKGTKHPPPG